MVDSLWAASVGPYDRAALGLVFAASVFGFIALGLGLRRLHWEIDQDAEPLPERPDTFVVLVSLALFCLLLGVALAVYGPH